MFLPFVLKILTSKRYQLADIWHCDRDAGVIKTIREAAPSWETNLLRTVFRNGELLVDEGFDVVREHSNAV